MILRRVANQALYKLHKKELIFPKSNFMKLTLGPGNPSSPATPSGPCTKEEIFHPFNFCLTISMHLRGKDYENYGNKMITKRRMLWSLSNWLYKCFKEMYGDQLVEFDGRYSSLLDQVDLPKGKFNGLLTLDRNNVLCMKTIILLNQTVNCLWASLTAVRL